MTDQPKDILQVIDELKSKIKPYPPNIEKTLRFKLTYFDETADFVEYAIDNYDQIAAELRAARAVCEATEDYFKLCPLCDEDLSGYHCICTRPITVMDDLKAWRKVRSEGK